MPRLSSISLRRNEPDLSSGAPAVVHPDPDRIRGRLARILAEARAAESMPWDANQQRLYEMIVPRMSRALSEDEAARIVAEFEREMARLR